MKFINEKGKLFGIINIIDLAMLLVVALVLVAAGSKITGRIIDNTGNIATGNEKAYIVTFKASKVLESIAESINMDDKIYYDTGFANGEVTKVAYEAAVEYVTTSDGAIVKALHPELKDVYIDVRITMEDDSDIIKLGPFQINYGKYITIKTTRFEMTGCVVTGIQEV